VGAVPELLLLHPAPNVVDRVVAQLDDVERVEHAHRVRQRRGQRGVESDRDGSRAASLMLLRHSSSRWRIQPA
jgi:hypothetical protein